MAKEKKVTTKKTSTKVKETKKEVKEVKNKKETKKATTKPVKKEVKKVEVKTVKKPEVKEIKKEEKKKKESIIIRFKNWFQNLPVKNVIIACTLVIAILLVILIGVSYRNTKLKNGKEIVAKVDGKTITADDLYSSLKETYGSTEVINAIDDYLINKEVKTTDEMRKAAQSTVDTYKSNYGDQWESFLSYYGAKDEAAFKDIVIKQSKLSTITEDYIKETLTEKEMKAYYETDIYGDIKASHILIAVNLEDDATEDEETKAYDAAKKKAEEIIAKLNKGEKFSDLAKKYSEDEGTKENGGDLGYFNTGQMVKEFEEAAYKLKTNKYTTTPVKTTYGYHIILKTDQKDKPSYKDAKDTIIEKITEEKVAEDTTIYYKALVNLREKYNLKIKDKAVKKAYNKEVETNTKSEQ